MTQVYAAPRRKRTYHVDSHHNQFAGLAKHSSNGLHFASHRPNSPTSGERQDLLRLQHLSRISNPQTAQNDVHLLLCPVLSSSFSTSTTTCCASIPRRNVSSWAGSTGVLTPAISSLCVIRHLFTVYHWSFTTSRLSDRPQRSSTSPSRHGRRAIIYQLLVGVCHAHVNHVSISVNRSPGGTDLLATQLGVRSSSRESSRHGFP